MRITGLRRLSGGSRLRVEIDGLPALTVTNEIAARFQLVAGAILTAESLQVLQVEQLQRDTMSSALRLIARRPRSEQEMRACLTRRATPQELVDGAVTRLYEMGLLNDEAFAAAWVEGRERTSPRSRRLLASELRAKGVPLEMVNTSVGTVDDAAAAHRASAGRLRSLRGLSFPQFQHKLTGFLLRRGFSYEITQETVRRCWSELHAGQPRVNEEMNEPNEARER